MEENITLGHGSGGKLMHSLIKDLFLKYFDNPYLEKQGDSAILDINAGKTAYTTDSYVIDPVFFPGGNIGKLAICGTVNDLAVAGATPKYISSGFIIEEGLPMKDLEKIVSSMAEEAKKANVQVVTGDTKVVNKGQCDKLFINTSGIGVIDKKNNIVNTSKIEAGDKIIINGSIAQHGMAIMAVRNFGNFKTDIYSDCACLNHLINDILNTGARIKFMRDATRGGLATVMTEIAQNNKNIGIVVEEEAVPVDENVRGMCELLGFDPFYVANEGKVVIAVHPDDADMVIEKMKSNEFGKKASIIGEVVDEHQGKAVLQTSIGGKRIIDMLAGEQLPRIC